MLTISENYNEAENYYYGRNGKAQDRARAREYYVRTIELDPKQARAKI